MNLADFALQIAMLAYFMLPAYIANMAPVLGKCILKPLAFPLDMGKKWKGKPILGKNKTLRGFLLAVFSSTAVFAAQQYFYRFSIIKSITIIDYSSSTVWLGFLLGFGAIAGDSVKSFFKRQMNVKPGMPWIPFDQVDFTIGAILFASLVYFPGWVNSFIIVALSALLHIFINHLAFYLKIRNEKW